jgi:hypothetical protein
MATIKEQFAANIVALWDFRKGSVADIAEGGSDGTFSGSPRWINTRHGKAIKLDASQGSFLGFGNILNSVIAGVDAQFTIAFVYKQNSTDIRQQIMIKNSDSTCGENQRQMAFRVGSSSRLEFLSQFTLTSGNFRIVQGNTVMGKEQIYHCAMSYDGSDDSSSGLNRPSMCVNGVMQTNSMAATGGTLGDIQSGTAHFGMGNQLNSSGAACGTDDTDCAILEVLVFDTLLTPTQLGQLYTDWQKEAFVNKIPTKTIQPRAEAQGDFEGSSAWTQGAGWTISGNKASSDGTQSAVSNLTQAIGAVGVEMFIEYQLSNRSAGTIAPLFGDTVGTAVSANGVYYENALVTDSLVVGLQASADFVGDIDWIKISYSDRLNLNVAKEDMNVTVANETSGFLSNTDFEILSGAWAINDNDEGKQITCVTGGLLTMRNTQAFGTYEWAFKKDSGGTTTQNVSFIGSSSAVRTDFSFSGYVLVLGSAERLAIEERSSGVLLGNNFTNTSYVTPGQWSRVRVTRSSQGVFTFYFSEDDGLTWELVPVASGSNPFTDTSVLTSSFLNLEMGAGDVIQDFQFKPSLIDPT